MTMYRHIYNECRTFRTQTFRTWTLRTGTFRTWTLRTGTFCTWTLRTHSRTFRTQILKVNNF